MITFGIKGFRKHLEALPPGAEAGISGKSSACPIASYGKAQAAPRTPVIEVCANGIHVWTRDDHTWRNPPKWVTRYVRKLDSANRLLLLPVTREQALAVLDEIEGVA